jgi:hypothetical protein
MWLLWKNNTINGQSVTTTAPQNCTVGCQVVGSVKTVQDRWIAGVDFYNTAPEQGRVLKSSDTLISAALWADVPNLVGTSGFGCKVDRITPTDWDYLTATWNNKKTATTWPTAGGEISTPQASFNSPTATGYQQIVDMLTHANDALSNRSGLLLFRLKADDEGAFDHLFNLQSDPDSETPIAQQARIIVTYESPQPGPTLMGLSPGIM